MPELLPEGTTWLDLVTLATAVVAGLAAAGSLSLTVRRDRAQQRVRVHMEPEV